MHNSAVLGSTLTTLAHLHQPINRCDDNDAGVLFIPLAPLKPANKTDDGYTVILRKPRKEQKIK
jgi:hypothetical protein